MKIFQILKSQIETCENWLGMLTQNDKQNAKNTDYKAIITTITNDINFLDHWFNKWLKQMCSLIFDSEIHLIFVMYRNSINRLFIHPFNEADNSCRPIASFLSIFTSDFIGFCMMVSASFLYHAALGKKKVIYFYFRYFYSKIGSRSGN